MIIGISGKKQSGKDTVGKIIQYLTSDAYINNPNLKYQYEDFIADTADGFEPDAESTWEIKKYAGKLKEVVSIITTQITWKDLCQ